MTSRNWELSTKIKRRTCVLQPKLRHLIHQVIYGQWDTDLVRATSTNQVSLTHTAGSGAALLPHLAFVSPGTEKN